MCLLSSPVLLFYNPAHLFSDLSCSHSRLDPEPHHDQSSTSAQALALSTPQEANRPLPLSAEGQCAGLSAYFLTHSPFLALKCPSRFLVSTSHCISPPQ